MKSRPTLQFLAVFLTAAGLICNSQAQDKAPPAPAKDKAPAANKAAPAKEAPAAAAGDFSDPAKLKEKAPESFKAKFETTKGTFVIQVQRSYSPNGVDRFYNLVKSGYFKDVVFFRVIKGFMAQFGIHGDPKVSAKWRDANIQDDTVKGSNVRGAICFAKSGAPNSRSTQFFLSFGDNSRLDADGFAAFGKVVEGMDVVDKLNSEYGEGAPGGRGPDQQRVQMEGNAYLKKDFPNLDSIKSATIAE
jgi:peptidyl-prolyl cis-trans isomerase A (cyclophilin A)